MDSYYELFDLESGNVIEDYAREHEAIEAFVQVTAEHGLRAIETYALTYVEAGKPILIARQDDLVLRVVREMDGLVAQRRSS
jgi:hypothetical protein